MAAQRTNPQVTRNPRATWALVCALIAALAQVPFVPIPYGGFLFGVAAVALGFVAHRDASRGMRGGGLAIVAIVIGALSFVSEGARVVQSF